MMDPMLVFQRFATAGRNLLVRATLMGCKLGVFALALFLTKLVMLKPAKHVLADSIAAAVG